MRQRVRGTSTWAAVALVVMAGLGLTACVSQTPMPVPSSTPEPGTSSTPEPTAPPEPQLDPQGSAADNLPYFDEVNTALVALGGSLDGRSFIDNLVTAGFAKSAMEVTPDRTSINAQADQIQFSVRMNGTCLIGQYGGGTYNGVATQILADGKCLIGATRPIDW